MISDNPLGLLPEEKGESEDDEPRRSSRSALPASITSLQFP